MTHHQSHQEKHGTDRERHKPGSAGKEGGVGVIQRQCRYVKGPRKFLLDRGDHSHIAAAATGATKQSPASFADWFVMHKKPEASKPRASAAPQAGGLAVMRSRPAWRQTTQRGGQQY